MPDNTDHEPKRTKLVPEMEGAVARWYARNRGSAAQLAEYHRQAGRLAAGLGAGADVLEVAPGPGYHAIALAKLGRFTITGLDVSHTMVEIAREHAARAGVHIDFRLGDVHRMPFGDGSFDLVVCQAAFKNFTRPVTALDEMYRVLRAGGTAVIQDLSAEAANADIAGEVARMGVGRVNALVTGLTLRVLRRRAHPRARWERLAAQSAFGGCAIDTDGIGVEIRLIR